jgi:signal peptidase I
MLRRALRVTGSAAIVLCFVLAAAMLIPALLGYQRYVITSGSMAGSYDTGALVYSTHVPVEGLRSGDVITYRPPADAEVPGLVTHRIESISRDAAGRLSFRTKGDANEDADPWQFVASDPTMAKVTYGVPHLGRVYSFINSRTGRTVLFMIPGILIALAAMAALWREAGEAARAEATA